MEIWKKIYDSGIYEISNYGNVRSIDRIDAKGRFKKGKLLSKSINNAGYEYASLFYNNKKCKKTIHRLVAEHFLEINDKGLVVNHKDGNKLNNHVDNLEWITQKENILHSWETDLSYRHGCKKIAQYDKNYNLIKIYDAIADAEYETGISNSKIVACCKKHKSRKTAGGYIWRYYGQQS